MTEAKDYRQKLVLELLYALMEEVFGLMLLHYYFVNTTSRRGRRGGVL